MPYNVVVILGYTMGIKRGYICMMESLFRIGMGGHQQLGDKRTVQFVEGQFEALLKSIRSKLVKMAKSL
jgi:hypothetical protein